MIGLVRHQVGRRRGVESKCLGCVELACYVLEVVNGDKAVQIRLCRFRLFDCDGGSLRRCLYLQRDCVWVYEAQTLLGGETLIDDTRCMHTLVSRGGILSCISEDDCDLVRPAITAMNDMYLLEEPPGCS